MKPLESFQFERQGYFCLDTDSDSGNETDSEGKLIINRTVGLRDSWAKIQKQQQQNKKKA